MNLQPLALAIMAFIGIATIRRQPSLAFFLLVGTIVLAIRFVVAHS